MKNNFKKNLCISFVMVISVFFSSADELMERMRSGKSVLEFYLDRADLVKDEFLWTEIASDGLEKAMDAWSENFHEDYDSIKYDEEKLNARALYENEISERHKLYTEDCFEKREKSDLYCELRNSLEKKYLELKSQVREQNLSEKQLSEMWKEESEKIIRSYATGDDSRGWDYLEKVFHELNGDYERNIILTELYDKDSLKSINEENSATLIARRLTDKAIQDSERITDTLFSDFDNAIEMSRQNSLELYEKVWSEKLEENIRNCFEVWKEAEEKIIGSRGEWEKQTLEAYEDENEKWLQAYSEFHEKKEEWKKSLSEKIEGIREQAEIQKKEYIDKISETLSLSERNMNEECSRYSEYLQDQRKVYESVRNVIFSCQEGIESWRSLWGKEYASLYDYWKSKNGIRFSETEKVLNGQVDVSNLSEDFLNAFKFQVKLIDSSIKEYCDLTGTENLSGCSENIVFWLTKTQDYKIKENEILCLLKEESQIVSGEVLSELDIAIAKAEATVKKIQEELNVASALNDYSLNFTNTRETAESTLAMKTKAEEELNDCLEKFSDDYELCEEKRISLRIATEIYDYAQSIYFDNLGSGKDLSDYKTPGEKLAEKEFELERAQTALDALIIQKNRNETTLSSEIEELIHALDGAENKSYLSSILKYEFERIIENYKLQISDAEYNTQKKRSEIISSSKINIDDYADLDLVCVKRNSNTGEYSVSLANPKSKTEEEREILNSYFNEATSVPGKINLINEDEYYTAAENEMINWISAMNSNPAYFQNVVLAAMYVRALNGYMDNVNNCNISPLAYENGRFRLVGIDPDDLLHSKGIFYEQRIYELQAAYNAVSTCGNPAWDSDVAKCILLKNTDSLFAGVIERIENYSLISRVYVDMYYEYGKIRDAHTYVKVKGKKIMDAKGKMADACMDLLRDMNFQVMLNLNDAMGQISNAVGGLYGALQNEQYCIDTLNYALGKNNSSNTLNDFRKVSVSLLRDNPFISADELNSLFEGCDETIVFNDNLEASEYLLESLNDSRNKVLSNLLNLGKEKTAKLWNDFYDEKDGFYSAYEDSLVINEDAKEKLKALAEKTNDMSITVKEREVALSEFNLLCKSLCSDGIEELKDTLVEKAGNLWGKESHSNELLMKEISEIYARYCDKNMNRRTDLRRGAEDYYSEALERYVQVMSMVMEEAGESQLSELTVCLNSVLKSIDEYWNQKIQDMDSLEVIANEQWKKSEELFNAEYNSWKKEFENDYEEGRSKWDENYSSFLSLRQEKLNEAYANYAFDSASIEVTDGLNEIADEIIKDSFKYKNYECKYEIENNLEEMSKNFSLLVEEVSSGNAIDCLNPTVKTWSSSGLSREYDFDYVSEIAQAMLEDQKQISARIAGQKAVEIAQLKKNNGFNKIAELNKAQRDWETELARNNGYNVLPQSISRNAVKGATLTKTVYQKQYVHSYNDFIVNAVKYTSDLVNMEGLTEDAVVKLISQIFTEYEQWEHEVFGNGNDTGAFGRHLGDEPVLIQGANIHEFQKENSFIYRNFGEITWILMDLQWNDLESDSGWSDYSKPLWDLKVADYSWAPTIRSASAITSAVAASVVSSAVSIASFGSMSAGAAALSAALISSAITMSNEALFATLDVAGGYKSYYDIGKELAVSAASSAINIATMGITDKVSGLSSAAARVAGNMLVQAGKEVGNSTVSSLIYNGGNISKALMSAVDDETLTRALVTSVASGVSGSLNEVNVGFNASKIKGFSSENISQIRQLNSLIGGVVSSGIEYGLTGKTVLNVASFKDVGLFEVEISDKGISGKIGMGGTNFSFEKIFNSLNGVSSLVENGRINAYSDSDKRIADALRFQYGFGNDEAKRQLEEILCNEILMEFREGEDDGDGSYAMSYESNGKKVIKINNDSDLTKSGLGLGIVLQHEAMRNGVMDSVLNQYAETISSVISHSMFTADVGMDPLYSKEVTELVKGNSVLSKDLHSLSKFISSRNLGEYAEYILSNYDSTADYWKITWGGQLINDGQGYLVDENGMYVNADGSKSDHICSNTLGAKGIETGLLNIINNGSNRKYSVFTDEEKLKVQQTMFNSGMLVDNPELDFKDYTWVNNSSGQKIDMYDFMEMSGKNVNDYIFNLYYNNSADLYLSKIMGVDLGFTSSKNVPGSLWNKFVALAYSHTGETPDKESLISKYMFFSDDGNEALYKISKDNPFLDELPSQHYFKSDNSEIDSWGCNFMSTIAIPQLLTGNLLDDYDILDLFNEAKTTVWKGEEMIIGEKAYVNNKNILVKLAQEKINNGNTIEYGGPGKIIAKRIGFKHFEVDDDAFHFAVGDNEGNVLYNPGYSSTMYKDLLSIYLK